MSSCLAFMSAFISMATWRGSTERSRRSCKKARGKKLQWTSMSVRFWGRWNTLPKKKGFREKKHNEVKLICYYTSCHLCSHSPAAGFLSVSGGEPGCIPWSPGRPASGSPQQGNGCTLPQCWCKRRSARWTLSVEQSIRVRRRLKTVLLCQFPSFILLSVVVVVEKPGDLRESKSNVHLCLI